MKFFTFINNTVNHGDVIVESSKVAIPTHQITAIEEKEDFTYIYTPTNKFKSKMTLNQITSIIELQYNS